MELDDAYQQQLGHWRATLHSGATRIGWKLGYTSPALQAKLGLDRSAVGHLTSATLVGADGSHSLSGAENPLVEPEVAIEVGSDGAVAGLAPALEIVDMPTFPNAENVGDLIAANISHRGVAIGASSELSYATGITATLTGAREDRDPVDAGIVDVPATITLVDQTLRTAGESLHAGDRIIAGALVAPVSVTPGDVIALDLGELGHIEVAFTP